MRKEQFLIIAGMMNVFDIDKHRFAGRKFNYLIN